MEKILKEDSINVKLVIRKVKVGAKEYSQLFLKFKNGFMLRIDSKFELTPKQWGMFQGTIEEELGE